MLCCTVLEETSNANAAKECMLKLMPLAKRYLSAFFKSLFSAKTITADMNELASEKWDSEEQLFFSSNSDCTHLKNPQCLFL